MHAMMNALWPGLVASCPEITIDLLDQAYRLYNLAKYYNKIGFVMCTRPTARFDTLPMVALVADINTLHNVLLDCSEQQLER